MRACTAGARTRHYTLCWPFCRDPWSGIRGPGSLGQWLLASILGFSDCLPASLALLTARGPLYLLPFTFCLLPFFSPSLPMPSE